MLKKIILLTAIAFASGCSLANPLTSLAEPAAKRVGELHAQLSTEQRAIGRAAYYDQTGIVVVSWQPDDVGYEDAVAKFITEPDALQKDYLQFVVGGDYTRLINRMTDRAAAAGGIKFDATGCVVLKDNLRLCETAVEE